MLMVQPTSLALAIQTICVTASGDPVDMSRDEAGAFAEKLLEAIQKIS